MTHCHQVSASAGCGVQQKRAPTHVVVVTSTSIDREHLDCRPLLEAWVCHPFILRAMFYTGALYITVYDIF
jgi:hypothetical protein